MKSYSKTEAQETSQEKFLDSFKNLGTKAAVKRSGKHEGNY